MNAPIILMYHQINRLTSAQDPFGISVTPDDFAAQMGYLKETGYTIIKLSDAVKAMRSGKSLPSKSVAITFDDGYLDNFENALPVLKQHRFPATVFLVADHVGDAARWDGDLGAAQQLMGWGEIQTMRTEGVEFGSHTRTHIDLGAADAASAHQEIAESKTVLESELGTPVELLAYPYERFNAQAQALAEKSGYIAACGTSSAVEGFYNLWRVEIGRQETDLDRFARKVSTWKRREQAKRVLRSVRNRVLRR